MKVNELLDVLSDEDEESEIGLVKEDDGSVWLAVAKIVEGELHVTKLVDFTVEIGIKEN